MSDPKRSLSFPSTDLPTSDDKTLPTQHGKGRDTGTDFPQTIAPSARDALTDATPSRVIAGYEVLAELGRGGMGVVYKARQKGLGRLVALKMILQADHAGADERARFQREAEALGNLKHENIVQVYEVGEHEGKPYFSLEYIEGGGLDRLLRDRPLRQQEAAALVEKLAAAMQTAHEAGIIHRDLKPANVLLVGTRDEGRGTREEEEKTPGEGASPSLFPLPSSLFPKITDFGLAKKLDEAGMSATGAVMGTPSYMAPEQAAGKVNAVDGRTDVYALGAILYECLTGRPPFRAATVMDTLLQVMSEEPVPVRSLQPGVHLDLETICHKCLQKEPGRRYASARELAEDLGRFWRGEPVLARPVGRLERGWRWCRRNPAVASLLAAVALLLVVGTVVSTAFGLQANREKTLAQDALERETEAREEVERAQGKIKQALADLTVKEHEERTAKEKEKEARIEEVNQRRKAEGLLYVSLLARTQSHWNEGDAEEARNTLNELLQIRIDENLPTRDTWESRYLFTMMNHRGQRTYYGHTEGVLGASFSPDGKRLASAGGDKTVKLWDASTGRELLTFKGHEEAVSCVSFSPDGGRLASASKDGIVKVWDASTGRELITLKGHTGAVSGVCFSPDGRRIASAGADRTVKLWNASSGKNLLTLRGHEGSVTGVSFSPDGRRIASASDDGNVKLWNGTSGKLERTLEGFFDGVASVAFSPDGKHLAWGNLNELSRGEIKVWDMDPGSEPRTIEAHPVGGVRVVFSPDGRRLASVTGLGDQTVKLWDVSTGQNLFTFRGHEYGVNCVSFSPDGKRLVSASDDQTVKVWDVVAGPEPLTLKTSTSTDRSVAFSPDGKRLATADEFGSVAVWDASTGHELLAIQGHTEGVNCVSFDPGGRRIVSAGGDKTVKLWDASTGRELLTFKGHEEAVSCVSFGPDGRRIASASQDGIVKVWDASTGQELLTLKAGEEVSCVSFNLDGTRLVTVTLNMSVKVWDGSTGREIHTFRFPEEREVTVVALSPDGKRLASAGMLNVLNDNAVKLWDTTTGKNLTALKGRKYTIQSLSFSPDGRRLVSGGGDRTVRLWDTSTGRELLSFKGHEEPVSCVTFSPDGRRLASASLAAPEVKVWDASSSNNQQFLDVEPNTIASVSFSPDGSRLALAGQDDTVKLWDAATGRRLMTLTGHTDSVLSVVFSPDGKRLASAGHDRTVKLWDAATGENLLTFTGHENGFQSVAFSPDGRRITAHDTKRVPITWDLATGKTVSLSDNKLVFPSSRSPDGRLIALQEGNRIRLHRLPGKQNEPPGGHRWWADPDYRWHQAQAKDSWDAGEWFGGGVSFEGTPERAAWDAESHLRRAQALSELKKPKEAVIHALRAILLDPQVGRTPPEMP